MTIRAAINTRACFITFSSLCKGRVERRLRHLPRLSIFAAFLVAAATAYADNDVATSDASAGAMPQIQNAQPPDAARGGVLFHCSPAEAETIKMAMNKFLEVFHWQV